MVSCAFVGTTERNKEKRERQGKDNNKKKKKRKVIAKEVGHEFLQVSLVASQKANYPRINNGNLNIQVNIV